jgi:hypothetical protein
MGDAAIPSVTSQHPFDGELLVASMRDYLLAFALASVVLSWLMFAGSIGRGLSFASAADRFGLGAALFGGGMFVFMLVLSRRRPRITEELPASATVLSVRGIVARGWRGFVVVGGTLLLVFLVSPDYRAAFLAGYGPGGLVAAFALLPFSRAHYRNRFIRISPHAWRPAREVFERR